MVFQRPAIVLGNAKRGQYTLLVKTTSGFLAVLDSHEKVCVFAADGKQPITIAKNSVICIWSCAGAQSPDHFGHIQSLECTGNKLKSLEIYGLHRGLEMLNCADNEIQDLPLAHHLGEGVPNLKHLNCSRNRIRLINLTNLSMLEKVICSKNPLEEISRD